MLFEGQKFHHWRISTGAWKGKDLLLAWYLEKPLSTGSPALKELIDSSEVVIKIAHARFGEDAALKVYGGPVSFPP